MPVRDPVPGLVIAPIYNDPYGTALVYANDG
jgi:hypothetical protein